MSKKGNAMWSSIDRWTHLFVFTKTKNPKDSIINGSNLNNYQRRQPLQSHPQEAENEISQKKHKTAIN